MEGSFSAGSLPASFHDVNDNALKVVPHVRRSDADRSNSTRGKPCVSSLVALRVRPKFMRETVHLDCDGCFVTEEVEIIASMLVLLAKLEAVRSLLQCVPQPPLGRGYGPAEFACSRDAQKNPPSALRAATSPRNRGEEIIQTQQSPDRPRGCRPPWPGSPSPSPPWGRGGCSPSSSLPSRRPAGPARPCRRPPRRAA